MNEQNSTEFDTIEEYKKPRGKKKLMIEALNDHLGIVTVAAKQVGIHRDCHYKWLKIDPAYKYWANESHLTLKDFGEQTLMQLLKDRNPMITWNFNKTQNRDRGYGEHIGIEHSVDQTITFHEEVLTDEQIKKMKNDKKNSIKPETK